MVLTPCTEIGTEDLFSKGECPQRPWQIAKILGSVDNGEVPVDNGEVPVASASVSGRGAEHCGFQAFGGRRERESGTMTDAKRVRFFIHPLSSCPRRVPDPIYWCTCIVAFYARYNLFEYVAGTDLDL